MGFFIVSWLVIVVGWLVHVAVDRHPRRRTRHRVVELALLWVLVSGGLSAVTAGITHLGPRATRTAIDIGYAPSMFQWEVGWGDIAVGVLGIGCAWRRLRDGWLTAAVVAVAVSFWGASIGHVTQLVAHNNHAPDNVAAIPSDIVGPLLAVVLLVAYRWGARSHPGTGGPAAR